MNRSNIICSDDTENNLKILLFFHVFVILLLYFILYNTIKVSNKLCSWYFILYNTIKVSNKLCSCFIYPKEKEE